MAYTLHKTRFLSTVLLYLASAFILLLPAFYNGYPLVTPDTGAYVDSGWYFHMPLDRPITYSIFVRIASGSGISLWGVVLWQTLILVYFLQRISRKVLGDRYRHNLFLAIILLLSGFTSAGWTTSHVMPDIFTAILLLAVADFFLSPPAGIKVRILYFLFLFSIIQFHNSNLLLMLVFCILAGGYAFFGRKKGYAKKIGFLFGATVCSFVSLSLFNLWQGNGFRPSASTHLFLISRMAENGILDKFLGQYCPTEHYELCKVQGNTGERQWDFMWSDKGFLHDKASWHQMEHEYNQIVFRSVTRPQYLAMHLYESIEGTIRQIPQCTVNTFAQGKGSTPYNAIEKHLSQEIKEYRNSLQQLNQLQGQMIYVNGIIFIFLIVLMVFTLFCWPSILRQPDFRNWYFFLLLALSGILINAWVTATFSTVIDRLQARVFWLLPFAGILFLVKQYLLRKNPVETLRE